MICVFVSLCVYVSVRICRPACLSVCLCVIMSICMHRCRCWDDRACRQVKLWSWSDSRLVLQQATNSEKLCKKLEDFSNTLFIAPSATAIAAVNTLWTGYPCVCVSTYTCMYMFV